MSEMPKRKLGKGRYDRKLIERMVELSVADNYDEAVREWVATGEVYTDDVPDWWESPSYCLCGHYVVYHFEVRNTLNNRMILVGSDHINTYQIIQEIKLSRVINGEKVDYEITDEMISDEMIDAWVRQRVETMKATAWWKRHGEHFTQMFDEVKEYDLRINVNVKKWRYSRQHRMNLPVTTLRKKSKNKVTDSNYEMASIVWRWNHPDNKRSQQKKGMPNDKLWTDLMIFHASMSTHRDVCDREDARLEMVAQEIDKKRLLEEHHRKLRVAQNKILREKENADGYRNQKLRSP